MSRKRGAAEDQHHRRGNINLADTAPYHRIIMCLACGYPSNPRPFQRCHVLAFYSSLAPEVCAQ
jgi:hypothetical protein